MVRGKFSETLQMAYSYERQSQRKENNNESNGRRGSRKIGKNSVSFFERNGGGLLQRASASGLI